MGTRLPGCKGEYLWEFYIADRQLSALAEAFPAERYGWRTAETARSVSEILVHVAAGNLTLLGIVGVDAAPDLYGKVEGEVVPRMLGHRAMGLAAPWPDWRECGQGYFLSKPTDEETMSKLLLGSRHRVGSALVRKKRGAAQGEA